MYIDLCTYVILLSVWQQFVYVHSYNCFFFKESLSAVRILVTVVSFFVYRDLDSIVLFPIYWLFCASLSYIWIVIPCNVLSDYLSFTVVASSIWIVIPCNVMSDYLSFTAVASSIWIVIFYYFLQICILCCTNVDFSLRSAL
jgi:hypothetical protein